MTAPAKAVDVEGLFYSVSGIRPSTDVPFSWYVLGPEGEVAFCQTAEGEAHADMIAAALNDRFAALADTTAEEDYAEMAAELTALRARVEELEEAMKPFAAVAEYSGYQCVGDHYLMEANMRLGDYRKARAALAGGRG